MKPKHRRFAATFAALWIALSIGCTGPVFRSRSQSPELVEGKEGESLAKLVGHYAVPVGTNYVKLEGPVLITGLKGTGSDPQPGPQRASLLADMQARKVQNPNKLLADSNNSLAWAQVYLPPGVQKGDRLDVEVRVPPQSDTTSIAGGWMMEARLREMALIDGQKHDGHVMAQAEGPVLVDPVSRDSTDPMALKKGWILGGGEAKKSRPLALMLSPAEKSVYRSKQIGDAINRRLHTYARGIKQGVANPVRDDQVDLLIHPRYKQNLSRYFHVIRSIPVNESPSQLLARLDLLERQLNDPITAQVAAIKLEAIGKEAIPQLERGMASKDSEVRFYSAEALAYLDQTSSVAALTEAARKEPAFRAFALAALCALNDIRAADALRELFDVPSAETRYGAFRALWAMNERDPQLRGEHLGDRFWLHVVPSSGPAMVHLAHSFRPEVVLFGENQKLELPIALEAGNSIIVKSQDDGQIRISRFAAGERDRHQTVKNTIDDVIRGIAEVGGDYPDVVQALQQARAGGALKSRFEVDAIPQRGRIYDRSRSLAKTEPDSAGSPEKLGVKSDDEAVDHSEKTNTIDQLPTLFGGGMPGLGDSPRGDSDASSTTELGDPGSPEIDEKKTEKTATRRPRNRVE